MNAFYKKSDINMLNESNCEIFFIKIFKIFLYIEKSVSH